MQDAARLELLSHHARERAAVGLGDVRDLKLRGVELVARAERGENGDAACKRGLDQVELAGDKVDAVEDVVVFRVEEALTARGLVASHDGVEDDRGVDVAAARGDGLRLALPKRGVQRLELAVEVRQRHGVVVDERQLAHARAHQRLDRVAAHAAETEHGDVAAVQSVHAVRAEHHFGA